MVHQPSYSQSPCCVHNESIFWGPEGQGSYLSCPLQQVIVVYSNVRFQSLGNSIFGNPSQMLCISDVFWTGSEIGQRRRCTKLAKSSQAKWILRNQIILCLITCQLCMISSHNHHHIGKLLLIVVCLFIRLFIRYVLLYCLTRVVLYSSASCTSFLKRTVFSIWIGLKPVNDESSFFPKG